MKKQVIMALFSLLSLFWIQPLAWAGKAADYAYEKYASSGVRFDDTKSSSDIKKNREKMFQVMQKHVPIIKVKVLYILVKNMRKNMKRV